MPEKSPISDRGKPLAAVFAYTVFAILWLSASVYVLTYAAEDPWRFDLAAVAGGLILLAIASGLFYLLFSRHQGRARADDTGGAAGPDGSIGLFRPLLVILLLILVVPVLGLVVIQLHGPELEAKAKESMQAIADLKAGQLEHWLNERRQDGASLARDPAFIRQVEALRAAKPGSASVLQARLEAMREAYDYESISLIDAAGRVLLQTRGAHSVSEAAQVMAHSALEQGVAETCLLCPDAEGVAHSDFIVPLSADGGDREAAVILHMNPEDFIFPFIEQWPARSLSGETLIVRRQDDRVVFLNGPRQRDNPPISLSLDSEDRASLLSLHDKGVGRDIVEGTDYRGHRVLAAYQPVSGTELGVVAKIDRSEVLAPLQDLLVWVTGVALAAVAAVGLAIIILWRQQRQIHGLALQAEKSRGDQVRAESEARLRSLVDTIPDLVWMKDPEGVFQACNHSFERLVGAARQDIIGGRDYDFFSTETVEKFRSYDAEALRTGEPSITEEELTFAEDGYRGTYETIKAPVYGPTGEFIGVLGIARNITERKENESRIRRLSQLYATLSQVNQAIIHCRSQEELFQRVCQLTVQSAGFKMACVLLPDEQGSRLTPAASYGEGSDYLQEIWISTREDEQEGRGPTGIALREGRPVWSQDFLNDPQARPWREAATRHGYAAAAALPIHRNGSVMGTFNLYSGEPAAFDEAVRRLLTEMAAEISYAIDNLEGERRRREVEERLALVLEGSNDAPWDWDILSDQHYYSPQWWHMLGYEVDELPRHSDLWRQLIHPDDIGAVDAAIERILLPGADRESVECRFQHKAGHYVPTLIRGIASRDANGRVVRLSGTIMDLTERKRIEQELKEQIQELQRWHDATLGRENRIIALKQEVNHLLAQAGLPPRYQSHDIEAATLTQGFENDS